MKKCFINVFSFFMFFGLSSLLMAQPKLDSLKWKNVVYNQPEDWYGSTEAIRVTENVLLYQRNVGGWTKNTPFHQMLTELQKNDLRKLQSVGEGATTDNGATTMELAFLSKVYKKNKDERYKNAFLKGLDYLLEAQYENGGWPQFYPLRKGYYTHITYNDDSMVHIMELMRTVAENKGVFSIPVDEARVKRAGKAFEKGIGVMLKTQYKQNGTLTVWCAQHDEITLEPAKARSYELPSLSGAESAGIVLMLMKIDNPSKEIINAVRSAVAWFENAKITGFRVEGFINKDGIKDRGIVADNNAPAMWARFNELADNRPFFCDRDGVKKYSLAEIGYERRNGYSWYGNGPQEVLDRYSKWQSKWVTGK